MVMQKESVLVGIIGLLVGLLIAGVLTVAAVNSGNRSMMQMMGMNMSMIKNDSSGHMGMSMNDMQAQLSNRSGDDFDENFIAMMIAHHQGAIDMAQLSESRAKHDEIKQLSRDIIVDQSKEIETMRQWQRAWSYSQSNSTNMMHRQ